MFVGGGIKDTSCLKISAGLRNFYRKTPKMVKLVSKAEQYKGGNDTVFNLRMTLNDKVYQISGNGMDAPSTIPYAYGSEVSLRGLESGYWFIGENLNQTQRQAFDKITEQLRQHTDGNNLNGLPTDSPRLPYYENQQIEIYRSFKQACKEAGLVLVNETCTPAPTRQMRNVLWAVPAEQGHRCG